MQSQLLFVIFLILFSSFNNKYSISKTIFFKKKKVIIYLQSFDDFPKNYLTNLEKNLKIIYSDVKVNKSIPFPDDSWNYNKSRRRADILIKFLIQKANKEQLIID